MNQYSNLDKDELAELRKNMATAWIDEKNRIDSVSRSWYIYCVLMVVIGGLLVYLKVLPGLTMLIGPGMILLGLGLIIKVGEANQKKSTFYWHLTKELNDIDEQIRYRKSIGTW